jgi:3-oxoadipate enol-lactonase
MNMLDLHFDFAPSRAARSLGCLVLLNPLGTTTDVWNPLLPALLERVDVLRVDYPGHGGSPGRDLPTDIDDIAALVLALLDGLGIDQTHVAGISIGGMVALRVAAAAPERVLSVAAICAALRMEESLWRDRERTVMEWGTQALAAGLLERWFTPSFRKEHAEIVAEYERMVLECTDRGYAAYSAVLAGLDLSGRLSEVSAPALVIIGAEDPAVPRTHGEEMTGLLPDARLEIFDGVAHMAQVMAPDRLATALITHATSAMAH